MADRRMLSKSVINSDHFLDMPHSSQVLYFHLVMNADDDGFVNNPRTIQRMLGCAADDLKLLTTKGFVIPFESGIIVITHWKKHNFIPKDRYKPTTFVNEYRELVLEGGVYSLMSVPALDTDCIQSVSKADTQVRLGKDRLGKDRLNIISAEPKEFGSTPPAISLQLNTGNEYPISQADVEKWSKLFPAVDVMQQLRSMKAWCEANPAKRKTQRGIRRFITSWLTREQDRGGHANFQKGSTNRGIPGNSGRGSELPDYNDFEKGVDSL